MLLEDAAEILRGDARYDALPSDGVDDTQGLIRRISAADVHAAQLAERPVILSLEHNLDRGFLARFDRARGRFEDERAGSNSPPSVLGGGRGFPSSSFSSSASADPREP